MQTHTAAATCTDTSFNVFIYDRSSDEASQLQNCKLNSVTVRKPSAIFASFTFAIWLWVAFHDFAIIEFILWFCGYESFSRVNSRIIPFKRFCVFPKKRLSSPLWEWKVEKSLKLIYTDYFPRVVKMCPQIQSVLIECVHFTKNIFLAISRIAYDRRFDRKKVAVEAILQHVSNHCESIIS